MRIIEIYLNENQSHSCTRNIFYAGRKYDSNNTAVKFTNKNLFIDGWNFYLKVDMDDEVTEIPLLQNLFIIGENLTQTAGVLTCTLIGRNSDDNSTKTFEPFRLKIEDVEYDQDDKEQQPMDPNMKLLYEQLINLKQELQQKELRLFLQVVIKTKYCKKQAISIMTLHGKICREQPLKCLMMN